MGALPVPIEPKRELPDYLPARMVNEFAYCPRLFFYEWVEGVFPESVDTVEGAIQHRRVDAKTTALPGAGGPAGIDPLALRHAVERRLRVIAKMDLVEAEGGVVTPVDYKHGQSAGGSGRAGTVAGRPGAAGGAGHGAAGERVPSARKASSITARRGSGCAWRSTRR